MTLILSCSTLYRLSCFLTIYKNSVRTSQETHYVSATETSCLMLFKEKIAVYCETRTKHINTLCMLKQMVHMVTTGL
jgi:hypothetical protein